MSLYTAPIQHNGVLNATFNSTDYLQTSNSSAPSQAQNDGRYLKNSGVVVSSAATSFNNSVSSNWLPAPRVPRKSLPDMLSDPSSGAQSSRSMVFRPWRCPAQGSPARISRYSGRASG